MGSIVNWARPSGPCGRRLVGTAVGDREVEPFGASEAGESGRPTERRLRLRPAPRSGVGTEDPVFLAVALQKAEGLGEVARGQRHLVPTGTHSFDQRMENHHMRRVSEVNPDPQRFRGRAMRERSERR